MSKLEELIKKLCPDGVIFKRLGEITNFRNGKGHEKNIVMSGNYIVVNAKFISTDGKVKKYSNKQISPLFPEDILMVMSDLPNGKALAKCFVVDSENKYTLNQRICALDIKDKKKLNYRFLYYILNRNVQLLKYDNKVDQTNLKKEQILKIKIPVPPIEVQNEIVRILDYFTKLEAELEAELEARKKQYEYYKIKLLNTNGTIINLGDIANYKTGSKPKNILVKNEDNNYEYINAGTTNSGYTKIKNFQGDVVTTPSRGQGGIGFVGYQKNDFWLGPLCYAIWSKDKKVLLNKYLYYELTIKKDEILKRKNTGGVPALNGCDLKTIRINIPNINEQKKIINILDKFEEISQNISQGLPAEIEARRKQYEYYRDKLLNFKELKVENKE